jgi:hypothetical protein
MTRTVYLAGSLLLAGVLALPAHADAQARPRDPGSSEAGSGRSGDSGGREAVPRAEPSPAPAPSSAPPATASGNSGRRGGEVTTDSGRADTVQPRGARAREGRPVVGHAVPRGSVPMRQPAGSTLNWYRPGAYYPWGYGTWGLGFYAWDPFAWGSPYGYGPYGYGPYGYAPYGYGYGGYGVHTAPPSAPSRASRRPDTGNLRLLVEPRDARDAQVFVNGYYVGIVDDFNGVFQRLRLDEGPHTIEVRQEGFDTLRFDVRVRSGRTVTLRGELQERTP